MVGAIDILKIDRQLLVCTMNTPSTGTWVCCGVYASNNDIERRIVFEPFRKVADTDKAMICFGDFYVILFSSDKKGG